MLKRRCFDPFMYLGTRVNVGEMALEVDESTHNEITVSKNALKKLKKQQWRDLHKEEWRQKRKEKKKRNLNVERVAERPPIFDASPEGCIIFDCAYSELMTDKELDSLCLQISRAYAVNRRFERPFMIEVYGFNEKLRLKLAHQHQNTDKWKNVIHH